MSALLASLGVEDGLVLHVLSYLDARDLAFTARTCHRLSAVAGRAWTGMDQRLTDARVVGLSTAPTPQARVCRFFKAQQYAQRMEAVAETHFDYDDEDDQRLVRCGSCHNLPNLSVDPFQVPNSYEFFMRFSYRYPPTNGASSLIWEGFVQPTSTRQARLRNEHEAGYYSLDFFGMRPIVPEMNWPSMTRILSRFRGRGRSFMRRMDRVLWNLSVTVVALRRQQPYDACLVVSTGGNQTCVSDAERPEGRYIMCLRNILSHIDGDTNNFVEVIVNTNESPNDSYFRGLEVTYWYDP